MTRTPVHPTPVHPTPVHPTPVHPTPVHPGSVGLAAGWSGPRLLRPAASLLVLAVLLAGQAMHPQTADAAGTGPTAVDDSATLPVGSSTTLAGARNDRAGSAAIQPRLTVFPSDGQPSGSVVSSDGQKIQVPKHGTFAVNVRDGSVTFTAWSGLTGNASVRYRIVDAAGATDDGTLSVVVTAGGQLEDVETGAGHEVPVVDLLANDTPGRNADGTPGTLDRASVRFDSDQPSNVTVSDDGRTVTALDLGGRVPVGVATIDDHGLLTFRASAGPSGFGGGSANVYYTARDTTVAADGSQQHHSYTTRVVLIDGATPNETGDVVTKDDHAATPFDASTTLPGGLDDHPADPTMTMRPDLSRFDVVGSTGPEDHLSADARKVGYPGRGTWRINRDGSVSYVPQRGFVGTDAILMIVFDDGLQRGEQELVVTVEPGPTAEPDTATTAQGVTTRIEVLADDAPGRNADGTTGSMDKTFVRFPTDGQPAGASVSAYLRTLTVPGQGVYRADRTTGVVSFDPDPSFVGTARPVTYSARNTVTRTDGRVLHHAVTATLTVTVTAARRSRSTTG